MKKRNKQSFKNVPEEFKIHIFMAISLIQFVIICRYKRMQKADKIIQYINGEYIEKLKKMGENQVDYDFLVLTTNYFKDKFNYDFKQDVWLDVYNRRRNKNFTSLQDALLYELNYMINGNQRELLYQELES